MSAWSQDLQALADVGKGRDAIDHVGDGGVDGQAPGQGPVQLGVGMVGHVGAQAVVALGVGVGGDKLADARDRRDGSVSGPDRRPLAQQVQDHHQGRPAIDAAPLGIQVHKLGGLAGEPGHRLEAPVFDGGGAKALFVLDLHRVKGAAVRVNADEEIVPGGQVAQGAGGIVYHDSTPGKKSHVIRQRLTFDV